MNNRKCLATTTLEDIMKESNTPLCRIILNWILQTNDYGCALRVLTYHI